MMRWKRLLAAFASVLALAALLAVWQLKLVPLAYYWVSTQSKAAVWKDKGVWLPYYRVAVEARAIEGLTRNASGLTYSNKTNSLFAAINQPPEIVELDTEGRLLRRIPVKGADDVEGIAHVRDDIFVLADERKQQLFRIEIRPDDEQIDLRQAPRLKLAIDVNGNLGFEGVSWDENSQRLLVVKEKSPMRVLSISGLPPLHDGPALRDDAAFNLQISEWKPARARTLFMSDLSSLTFHEATGNLLLLSDESALVVEYAPDGSPVSLMPLWKGLHGLQRRVPQAEGIAVGPDGTLYILSEPNLFYRFERRPAPSWVAAKVSARVSATQLAAPHS